MREVVWGAIRAEAVTPAERHVGDCEIPDDLWLATEAVVGYRVHFAMWPWQGDTTWRAEMRDAFSDATHPPDDPLRGVVAELSGETATAATFYARNTSEYCWHPSWLAYRQGLVALQAAKNEEALELFDRAKLCEAQGCVIIYQSPGCAPFFSATFWAARAAALESIGALDEAAAQYSPQFNDAGPPHPWLQRGADRARLPEAIDAATTRLAR